MSQASCLTYEDGNFRGPHALWYGGHVFAVWLSRRALRFDGLWPPFPSSRDGLCGNPTGRKMLGGVE